MAYTDAAQFKIPRHIVLKGGVNIETITTNVQLTYADSQHQIITNNRGSAADIRVPENKDGAWFWFKNDAASGHAIIIQTAAGAPIIGGSGLAAGKAALIACNGSEWAVVFQQA